MPRCPDVALNLVDRLFLLLDGIQGPSSTNLYALTVDGEWDVPTMRRAITRLVAEQPLVSTRAWRTAWRLVRQPVSPCSVDEILFVGDDQPGTGFENASELGFMRRTMNLAVEPPMRILLRRGRIVMAVHHSVADGIGGYFLLDRLAAHYEAECNGLPVAELPVAPSRSYFAYLRRFSWLERARVFSGMGRVLGEMLFPLGPYAFFGDQPLPTRGEFAWRELVIPPTNLPRLRQAARNRSGTLNDLLLAATAVAGWETWPNSPERSVLVMMPASLREGPAVDIANRAAELPICLSASVCSDWPSAFDVVKQLTPQARDRGRALARIFQYALASVLPPPVVRWVVQGSLERKKNHALTYVFSNTGILDPQPRDFGPVRVCSVAGMPPLTVPPGFGVVAATARGCLTLTVAWADPATSVASVTRFCEALEALLDRLAQESGAT